MITRQDYIKQLNLEPHPEGGWYKQLHHSEDTFFLHLKVTATAIDTRQFYSYSITEAPLTFIDSIMMNYGISMRANQL